MMTELFQNHQPPAGEDQQTTAGPGGTDHEIPTQTAGPHTLPATQSSDALEPSTLLAGATNNTAAACDCRPVENVENNDGSSNQPNEVSTPRTPLPPVPKPDSLAAQLHTEMKRIIVRQTRLPDSVSSLIAFWALSTWFQEVFPIIPCLVITGPNHEATVILSVLNALCAWPRLLAGFRRADLRYLRSPETLLIAEPNLDNRTAALLGNFTNRGFLFVSEGYFVHRWAAVAVYVGEDPAIKRIQHSLQIDAATPPHAKPLNPAQFHRGTVNVLLQRIFEYYERNKTKVAGLEFNPSGLSPEGHAMANALGSCIVDDPQLQMELVSLMRPQDLQQSADRSDCLETLVAGAALTLCHQGKDEVFVREIAAEVNRVLKARGEILQFTPEKVGHKLKRIGLLTRRLSHAGNGLNLDQQTRIRIHEVATAHQGNDLIEKDENLQCPLCALNQCVEEDM
jgi:hypothetical protein